MRPVGLLASAILLVTLPGGAVGAPAPTPPCQDPPFRQFDFWVGTWDLVSHSPVAGKDEWGVDPGTPVDHVEAVLDGCGLLQRWEGVPDSTTALPFRGMSLSKWEPTIGKWRQVWIDNQGPMLVFKGEFKDGRMELYTDPVSKDGKTIVMRQVFGDITKGAMSWSWERSEDGGASFKPVWKLDYKRRAS
ncbi:MAG: hypothetical protein ABI960_11090 [Candidatus Eisenbacteria bacterium]